MALQPDGQIKLEKRISSLLQFTPLSDPTFYKINMKTYKK